MNFIDQAWKKLVRLKAQEKVVEGVRLDFDARHAIVSAPNYWSFAVVNGEGMVTKLFGIPVEPNYAQKAGFLVDDTWEDI